jgi:hypothetical protein
MNCFIDDKSSIDQVKKWHICETGKRQNILQIIVKKLDLKRVFLKILQVLL